MWPTLIAVLGTLAGSLLTTLVQRHTVRADATAAHHRQEASEHRRAVVAALRELVTALDAHRRAMWVREDARLSDAPADEYARLRAESHTTRAAISAPLVSLRILVPSVTEQAHAAAQAAFALRSAPDQATLNIRRTEALTAADALVEAVRLA
jgi:hypothetical protein